jgi:DNA-binding MarR family transcriptional regulator
MSYSLVTEPEFCWVLEWVEPAETTVIAELLPTSTKAVYMRLRRFEGAYVTRTTTEANEHRWSLTEAGREVAAAADLPPVEETDLTEHFAGRSTSINPAAILYEIAIDDAEWVPSSTLYEALPYAKSTVRKRLNKLHDAGGLDRDASGRTNHWRLTEGGREQLAEADDHDPRDESARIYESRPV